MRYANIGLPYDPLLTCCYPFSRIPLCPFSAYSPYYRFLGSDGIPAEHAGGPERLEERPPHTQVTDWSALYPGEVILHGPAVKQIALTFDDGPDMTWTPQVLDVLKAYNAKALFMCVGWRVQQYPDVLRRIVKEGHIVGNHTWSHPNLTKISVAEVKSEIERTEAEINRIIGRRTALFRPPYGALNDGIIKQAIALKYKVIMWDVDSLDWSGITAEQVAANILSHVHRGAIVLQHSAIGAGGSLQNTVNALPYTLETLQKEGYTFPIVSELLGIPAYRQTVDQESHSATLWGK